MSGLIVGESLNLRIEGCIVTSSIELRLSIYKDSISSCKTV